MYIGGPKISKARTPIQFCGTKDPNVSAEMKAITSQMVAMESIDFIYGLRAYETMAPNG